MSKNIIHIFVITSLLALTAFASSAKGDDSIHKPVAEVCKWLKKEIGYGCDGKIAREIWRTYWYYYADVTNCNSYCKAAHGKSGGSCSPKPNYDESTWCDSGKTCICK